MRWRYIMNLPLLSSNLNTIGTWFRWDTEGKQLSYSILKMYVNYMKGICHTVC